ncbi:MAG: hypothetical protein AAFP69_20410, partial [Planctomycetota bacterium]
MTRSWPDVSTPTESAAFALAAGRIPVDQDRPAVPETQLRAAEQLRLPHDLWPELRWNGIQTPIILACIGGQFGVRIQGNAEDGLRSAALPNIRPFVAQYDAYDPAWLRTLKLADKRVRVSGRSGATEVLG